ncbi:MAG: ABC transporter substrate-binding protein [Sphingomonas sp.]|uniref:ABC transporter substrate-binding protein n=1 Tax=Sphingomonas sp. TaxID=28214 RepID=UPI00260E35A1|nr:ABC transporter substrate-binding protein [Sphingomonas sp.]MDK2766932.1 ABC transporter substrate-binding protein [Sphingomonas sp.]
MCLGLLLSVSNCTESPPISQVPSYYPSGYQSLIDAAENEGRIVIWSSTDNERIGDALRLFATKFPMVKIEYHEMETADLYRNFIADVKSGKHSADFVFSSAMDTQMKLVNDGYALSYESPERTYLAPWANWKDQAWGVTAEPVVFLANRTLLHPTEIPDSHIAFRNMLENTTIMKNKVVSYDPTVSAFGYLVLYQDELASPSVWRTVRGLGANNAKYYRTADVLIEEISSGRAAFGYNILGSYAADAATRDPRLKIITPKDYTLVSSRIAIIPSTARHPAAAKVFLDFILSQAGQAQLANHQLKSVRRDVPAPEHLSLANTNERAIRVGPALLVLQDQLTRQQFLAKWDAAIQAGKRDRPN